MQKIQGTVARVSAAGYGVIKSQDYGEVMWRQYELPTNLRTMQTTDPAKFQEEVQSRDDFQRLKAMEGRTVEAELYRLPDGQLRAWHVKTIDAPGQLANEAHGETDKHVVCVRPLPQNWGGAELRERFEWYGNLVEATVERRVYGDITTESDEPVWLLGVLRFDDPNCAEQVIRHENGGSLDGGGQSVTVELGIRRTDIGWCDGVVSRYSEEHGMGLIRSEQVNDEIHFEAPPEMRTGDLRGSHVEAKVETGGDGSPQALEVRAKAPERHGKDKNRHGSAGDPMMANMFGGHMGMQPGTAANDPYYKTQPCPYYRQGMCRMGAECYFAHTPDELRPAPESLVMSQMAKMLGGGAPKKDKKDKKKEKKRKREASYEPQDGRARSESSGSASAFGGAPSWHRSSASQADAYRGMSGSTRRSHRSSGMSKRQRVELDDADF